LSSPPARLKPLSNLSTATDWTKADLSQLTYTIPPDIEQRMKASAYFQAELRSRYRIFLPVLAVLWIRNYFFSDPDPIFH
jgi:hypothetical protein